MTRSIEQVERELTRLEEASQTDTDKVMQQLGDRLSDWEMIVTLTKRFELGLRIGTLLENLSHWWLALSWYQWIAVTAKEDASPDVLMQALRAKGRVYIRLQMYKDALPYLKRVEEHLIRHGGSDAHEFPILLQNIALVYERLGQFEKALDYALEARARFAQHDDVYRVSIVEMMVGTNLTSLKRFEEALTHLERARDGFEQVNNVLHLARAWHNYAELMRDWGRMEEAIAAWRMSLEMKKKTRDVRGQVNTLLSITEYFISQNDWHGALSYINQAFPLCHKHRLYDHEVLCLERWSQILFSLGRYSEMEVVATRATFLSESVSAKQQVATLLQKVSGYYQQVGFEQLAQQYSLNAIQYLG